MLQTRFARSHFGPCNLNASGPREGLEPFLEMQAISKPPLQGCNVAPHGSSKRKKLIARTVHMRSLEDVRVHRCPTPAYSSPSPFDHQNLTLRFVTGWKVMAVI